jgi:acyl carrier protein
MGLDVVEMIMGIEEEFDIDVPDLEWQEARTVGLVYETVCRHLGQAPASPPEGTETRERLLGVIEDQTSISRGELHYNARFVEDLDLE